MNLATRLRRPSRTQRTKRTVQRWLPAIGVTSLVGVTALMLKRRRKPDDQVADIGERPPAA